MTEMAMPFRVIWYDDQVLAVEKPAGMVTHPAYRHPDATLTDAVWGWAEQQGWARPWLLHRLDRDTSGLVLFARTPVALRLCARQFQHHTVRKGYLALVHGTNLADHGTIDAPLCRDPADRRRVIVDPGGAPAQTTFSVAERLAGGCLVWLWPQTGRMHQLRVHLASIGHPIISDPVYATRGSSPHGDRMWLHAATLSLLIPAPGQPRRRTFLAPLPAEDVAWLDRWRAASQLPIPDLEEMISCH